MVQHNLRNGTDPTTELSYHAQIKGVKQLLRGLVSMDTCEKKVSGPNERVDGAYICVGFLSKPLQNESPFIKTLTEKVIAYYWPKQIYY